MKIPKSSWCKRAVITMVEKDMNTKMVADEIGFTPQYVAAIVYDRIKSPAARKKISSALDISDSDEPMTLTITV